MPLAAFYFVLAHEAAHVFLGHFNEEGASKSSIRRELEADALAIKILTRYFATFADLPEIRASLAAFMFLSLNRMWQKAVDLALNVGGKEATQGTHPGYDERFEHLASQMIAQPQGSTPGWFGLVFNAIRLSTETMSDSLVPELIRAGGGLSAISARVLPKRYAPFGRREIPGTDQWPKRVADLILSEKPAERRLGLWFLLNLQLSPAFYSGLNSDDSSFQEVCRKVLISVEPMYEGYMTRLMERLREEDENDRLEAYTIKISNQLDMSATLELGLERAEGNPMDHGFWGD